MSASTLVDETAIVDWFAQRSEAFDDGSLPADEAIRHLGDLGLLDLGAPSGEDGRFGRMRSLISQIAEHSLAAAFSTWAHRMATEYVLLADTPGDRTPEIAALRRGRLPGVTAMASAITHSLDLGDLDVTFERIGGAVRLNGHIRWASNFFGDGFLLITAAVGASGERIVVAVPSGSSGLRISRSPELLALDATASGSVVLDDVLVDERLVLTTDLDRFLGRMRAPFLLLQSAFALGFARAALRGGAGRFTGVNSVFADRFAEVGHRYATAEARIEDLSDPLDVEADLRPVLQLRLDTATLAQDAVALEARLRGGAGYLRNSPTARRIREAAFLPIQSPTEGLLRWELTCSNS